MELIKLNINSTERFPDKVVLTIGEFDGIHYAHRKLIEEVVTKASMHNAKSAVVTFYPHPDFVLKKRSDDGYLTIFEEKVDAISKIGIDYLVVIDFSIEVGKLSPEEFEVKFIDKFNVDTIICGYDFKYGYKGMGNYNTLKKKYNVILFNKIEKNGEKISSTKVRDALLSGCVEEANELLSRPFSLKGKVIDGNKIGSKIGLATANISYDASSFHLKPGVYSTYVYVDNTKYIGICNIGHNPSFNYVDKLSVEVHILDFDKQIYGDVVQIEFMHFIREEQKFPSPKELLNQINKDIQFTKEKLCLK